MPVCFPLLASCPLIKETASSGQGGLTLVVLYHAYYVPNTFINRGESLGWPGCHE